jgi:hypothetical protein
MTKKRENERIKHVLGVIEKGGKVADIVGTSLSIVKSVIELTSTSNADGQKDLAVKADGWKNGMDQPALEAQLVIKRQAKAAFLDDLSRNIGDFVHERHGKLPLAQAPQQLWQAILGGGIDPFLGSIICAGMVASDGYLTRRA